MCGWAELWEGDREVRSREIVGGQKEQEQKMDIQGIAYFGWVVQYNTCEYSSVHGPRWCADSWDSMEQPDHLARHSLAKARDPSGWIMLPVLAQSHPWIDVPSMDGASTTVRIVKMQEWCAKVGRCESVLAWYTCVLCVICNICSHLCCVCTLHMYHVNVCG